MSGRYAIATLGCKVNQADSAVIAADLEEAGYQPVPFGDAADVVVVNTCAVTAKADRDGRKLVARAKAASPDAVIIVTGCSPETSEPATVYADASIVCGNVEKGDILSLLFEHEKRSGRIERIEPIKTFREVLSTRPVKMQGRTRAFCKIQDGCSFSCTYCIVPIARGPSRSVSLDQVVEHYRFLAEAGYGEIVLIGIHLGLWGRDLKPSVPFPTLIQGLVTEYPDVRLRLSSVEPLEVDEDLIALFGKHQNLCRHVHIPLQSGSNEILKRMNRNYDSETFKRNVERLADVDGEMTIGADVIVGFPGETDDHFEQTRSLIDRLPLSHLHVFAYSKRPGTKAATMPDQVPLETIKKRSAVLRDLGTAKRRAHYLQFIGKSLQVLSEGSKPDGFFGGMSDNYIPLRFEKPVPEGKIVEVTIEREIQAGRVPGLFGIVNEDKN